MDSARSSSATYSSSTNSGPASSAQQGKLSSTRRARDRCLVWPMLAAAPPTFTAKSRVTLIQ
ncbi:uncharacterized protein FOMMEDRAFT_136692 [Fomitiporia mediterranea MF3/22]|uniref:uncharacterized protein n=1 Tax=Fomitiporia mediterranea (strain MF3/22) TaxID=694068 RepID=UPI000440945B|nr:uncharacterized protein FOMMEDRAFT_136692 [Fomitiporia mediterranea MF3/22]EJC98862.1 hypothetical protein FOMMEDRAFT_136692 [Fomitiporia mediterranea MF3/22]